MEPIQPIRDILEALTILSDERSSKQQRIDAWEKIEDASKEGQMLEEECY